MPWCGKRACPRNNWQPGVRLTLPAGCPGRAGGPDLRIDRGGPGRTPRQVKSADRPTPRQVKSADRPTPRSWPVTRYSHPLDRKWTAARPARRTSIRCAAGESGSGPRRVPGRITRPCPGHRSRPGRGGFRGKTRGGGHQRPHRRFTLVFPGLAGKITPKHQMRLRPRTGTTVPCGPRVV